MYIRISNPKFLEIGNSGRPAAGYLVYTLVAGSVSTLLTTYSDKDLTSPHTNPIVLDSRGECDIFTSGAVKLVYTEPTGDLTSPIWTEDYVAEQQGVVSDKGNGVWAGNNKYTLDIVPAYTSIPDGFSLVMIPDTTCLGTLVIPVGATTPTVFTGTGINDGIFSGRYTGSVAGAVFAATIDSCFVTEPDTAPTAVVSADVATTSPDAGVHLVAVTYITTEGETLIGPTDSVTADGVHKIDLSDIPLGPTDKGITGRRIYMTEAGGSDFYRVDEIADVVTDTYQIDIDDTTLAGNDAAPVTNDTGSGSGVDTFSWQIDSGTLITGVPISNTGPQTLQDGLFVEFSNTTGHTVGDVWTVTVMTPVSLDFCGLGYKLIRKSEGGQLTVLDASDMIANYPAHLDYSLAEDNWILLNPSLPVLESLIPLRRRKEITGNYTVDASADQGLEINATGTLTLTLPACPNAVSHFFYFRNGGTGVVTIDAGIYTIKGPNASTMLLVPGMAIQLATNGVDWHILTTVGYPLLVDQNIEAAGVASSSFTDLIPGVKYRLDYEIVTAGGGTTLTLRFNDAVTGYVGAIPYTDDVGAIFGDGYINNGIPLANDNAIGLGTLSWGSIYFSTIVGDNTYVKVNGVSTYWNTPHIYSGNIFGWYDGAADLTKATVITDGTFTGILQLYQVG